MKPNNITVNVPFKGRGKLVRVTAYGCSSLMYRDPYSTQFYPVASVRAAEILDREIEAARNTDTVTKYDIVPAD